MKNSKSFDPTDKWLCQELNGKTFLLACAGKTVAIKQVFAEDKERHERLYNHKYPITNIIANHQESQEGEHHVHQHPSVE